MMQASRHLKNWTSSPLRIDKCAVKIRRVLRLSNYRLLLSQTNLYALYVFCKANLRPLPTSQYHCHVLSTNEYDLVYFVRCYSRVIYF